VDDVLSHNQALTVCSVTLKPWLHAQAGPFQWQIWPLCSCLSVAATAMMAWADQHNWTAQPYFQPCFHVKPSYNWASPAPLSLCVCCCLVFCCLDVCCQLLLSVVVPLFVVLFHHVPHGLHSMTKNTSALSYMITRRVAAIAGAH